MPEFSIEPERYELLAGPAYHFTPDRREFFKLLGAGLLVVLTVDAQESGSGGRGRRGGQELPRELGAWLHVGEDGPVTVYTGKTEVGQNIRTSLTQAVADELRTTPASIKLVMADTDLTPYDMGTFGSRTTPTMAPQLRKVAAAGREMLLDLAASKWQTDKGALVVADARIKNPATGASLAFGALAKNQNLSATVDAGLHTTPPSQWAAAGKDLQKINARDIVTGKHRYTSDLTRPGMLHGRVVRPEAFQATLVSADYDAAQFPNVTIVRDGNFLGVASANQAALSAAIGGIKAQWKTTQQPAGNELYSYLKSHATDAPVSSFLATYTVAYIAHTPLEPRAALAEWNGDKLTVWTGSQVPFGVRSELAQAFGIADSSVRVIVPDTGSAYGGKHTGEAAIEAARLAKAAGKPVKLVWTREEEFTWAYFRPAGVIDISAEVQKDGTITSWEFHNYNSGPSGIPTPYNVPNPITKFHNTDSPLRQGSYRGLAATANHFARESYMDELAHSIGMEPLEFRLKNLKDQRLRAVLEAAAERFGWGKSKSDGSRGFGIAGGLEKGGYVACCAEVSISERRKVKIERAVTAFECGAIVNPKHLENQVEGATIMGIGGALLEEIEFDNGRILNPRLSRYRVPRFSDVPRIETVLLDRKDIPSAGAGETPIVGIAPAVGNAIFNATGTRLRAMPMRLA
jgi:nicotinate dehydrogenase subunit B